MAPFTLAYNFVAWSLEGLLVAPSVRVSSINFFCTSSSVLQIWFIPSMGGWDHRKFSTRDVHECICFHLRYNDYQLRRNKWIEHLVRLHRVTTSTKLRPQLTITPTIPVLILNGISLKWRVDQFLYSCDWNDTQCLRASRSLSSTLACFRGFSVELNHGTSPYRAHFVNLVY